ncbi:aldose epimerase family protein [Pontivivens ytuae]|uniref:Galactose mutarotase n=1 Tax=Pontivivens ytuae TaxID=2789856 RepID=A0A7S9QC35_9RHOB|nr:aldose epimerase family protein [Pontivivens ytuae]QPH53513.1 galactose mutarotase [Pontivivens ytuae]
MQQIGSVNGTPVHEHILDSGAARVSILSYGATIRDWRIDSVAEAMVLGFPDFETYLTQSRAHGVIAGRVANRTGFGRFTLDGTAHQLDVAKPPHHLHGGGEGLGKVVWEMEPDGDRAVRLTHTSPHGHMGYPGEVAFSALFELDGPRLTLTMEGQPDRRTPINLAQHNYYTLGATTGVRDHVFHAAADRFTPTDDTLLPTGEIAAVAGTRYDFRTPRSSREADPDEQGIDINMVLADGRPAEVECCTLLNPANDVRMRMWTDQPGLQVFNTWHFRFDVDHHDGLRTEGYQGFAVEPQHFPDSLNNPDWPSIIYSPDRPYKQVLGVEIARG